MKIGIESHSGRFRVHIHEKVTRPSYLFWLASLVLLPVTANSQDLLLLGGLTDTDDPSGPSYGWQMAIQETFTQHVKGSIAWINEGHLAGHHRDGAALQVWLSTSRWGDRIELSAGIGPYAYFDTQETSDTRGYADHHGVGGILTTALSLHAHGPWSLNLQVNAIHAPGNQGTRSLLLGIGYRFDELLHRAEHTVETAGSSASPHAHEIQLFGGVAIGNDLQSPQSGTFGADFRSALTTWSAWSATWFHNESSPDGRYDHVATQLWLTDSLRRFVVGAGLGPRIGLGATSHNTSGSISPLDGLFSLRVEWPWSERHKLIVTGHRAFTRDDLDQDIFTLGVAWQF